MSEQSAPNLEKLKSQRFQVPEHSADTLHQFRNEMTAFIADHPEVAGVTVYGSHLKGKARTEADPGGKSDLDAYVFVDEDKAKLPIEHGGGVSATTESANWTAINDSVGKPFREIYAKANRVKPEDLKDMRFRLISNARVDTDLKAMDMYTQQLEQSKAGKTERPSLNSRPIPDVARIFHMQLGKGLDPYRSHVLEQLQAMGERGDEIWETFFYEGALAEESGKLVKGISDETIDFQEKRKALFPHTVAEAKKYFHLGEETKETKR